MIEIIMFLSVVAFAATVVELLQTNESEENDDIFGDW